MSTKSALAQQLGVVAGFDNPDVDLEQYTTPTELAATIIHEADLRGDIDGRTVIDLGAGTGMLALAAALRSPTLTVGVELDRDALATALENEGRVGTSATVEWLQGDAGNPPIATDPSRTTVVMNPPFGAQEGSRGADKPFLDAARSLGSVSYSVHNAGSRDFIEAYADDHDGEVTHAFAAEFDIDHQFDHHTEAHTGIDTEVYRIEWGQ